MVPDSQKPKRKKEFIHTGHVPPQEVSTQWLHDKFEAYSHGYEAKHSQNFKNRYRNPSKDFMLQINNKNFTVNNFENMDKNLFASKLSEHMYRLKLDEEISLITKIKILYELNKQNSKHFDKKEYEGLLVKFLDLSEKHS